METQEQLLQGPTGFANFKPRRPKPKPVTMQQIIEQKKEQMLQEAYDKGELKAKEQKFGDNGEIKHLQEQRNEEAKQRLLAFIHSDRTDLQELHRLIQYFAYRYDTFIKVMTSQVKAVPLIKVQTQERPQQESKADAEIKYYIKKNKLPEDSKIFKVLGQYHCLREYLAEHFGVENDWKPKFEGHKFNNTCWHFLYTTKSRDAFNVPLLEWQYVNHIGGAKALTTKVGLTHSMNNLIWQHDRDISQTFPCSYDLSDLNSEDATNFKQNAKFNQVLSFLITNKQKGPKVFVATEIIKKRIASLSLQGFAQPFNVSDIDLVSDELYQWFKNDVVGTFIDQKWFKQIIIAYQDQPVDFTVLDQYAQIIGRKQFDLNVGQNAWILKPGGKSRGRGIEIYTDLDALLQTIQKSRDSVWIAQKYIERPLIIIGKKFDIRVWVLVTSVEPLTVWMFQQPYLRFTSEDYDSEQLTNKFMHLTNATISKENYSRQLEKIVGDYQIYDNMWELKDFAKYLENEYHQSYTDKVLPQIKQGVIDSLLSVKDVLQHRARSHELFGYDFMVDQDLNVWLIEVNSSPSMEYSTSITERLVRLAMPQIVRILLDHQHGDGLGMEVGGRIEDFELILK